MSQAESTAELLKQVKALKLELKIVREQKKNQEERFRNETDELAQMVRDEVNKSIRYKVELEKYRPTAEDDVAATSGNSLESPDRKQTTPRGWSLLKRKSTVIHDQKLSNLEAELSKTKKELKESQTNALEQAKMYEKSIEKLTQQVVEAVNTRLSIDTRPEPASPPSGKRTEMEKLMMQTFITLKQMQADGSGYLEEKEMQLKVITEEREKHEQEILSHKKRLEEAKTHADEYMDQLHKITELWAKDVAHYKEEVNEMKLQQKKLETAKTRLEVAMPYNKAKKLSKTLTELDKLKIENAKLDAELKSKSREILILQSQIKVRDHKSETLTAELVKYRDKYRKAQLKALADTQHQYREQLKPYARASQPTGLSPSPSFGPNTNSSYLPAHSIPVDDSVPISPSRSSRALSQSIVTTTVSATPTGDPDPTSIQRVSPTRSAPCSPQLDRRQWENALNMGDESAPSGPSPSSGELCARCRRRMDLVHNRTEHTKELGHRNKGLGGISIPTTQPSGLFNLVASQTRKSLQIKQRKNLTFPRARRGIQDRSKSDSLSGYTDLAVPPPSPAHDDDLDSIDGTWTKSQSYTEKDPSHELSKSFSTDSLVSNEGFPPSNSGVGATMTISPKTQQQPPALPISPPRGRGMSTITSNSQVGGSGGNSGSSTHDIAISTSVTISSTTGNATTASTTTYFAVSTPSSTQESMSSTSSSVIRKKSPPPRSTHTTTVNTRRPPPVQTSPTNVSGLSQEAVQLIKSRQRRAQSTFQENSLHVVKMMERTRGNSNDSVNSLVSPSPSKSRRPTIGEEDDDLSDLPLGEDLVGTSLPQDLDFEMERRQSISERDKLRNKRTSSTGSGNSNSSTGSGNSNSNSSIGSGNNSNSTTSPPSQLLPILGSPYGPDELNPRTRPSFSFEDNEKKTTSPTTGSPPTGNNNDNNRPRLSFLRRGKTAETLPSPASSSTLTTSLSSPSTSTSPSFTSVSSSTLSPSRIFPSVTKSSSKEGLPSGTESGLTSKLGRLVGGLLKKRSEDNPPNSLPILPIEPLPSEILKARQPQLLRSESDNSKESNEVTSSSNSATSSPSFSASSHSSAVHPSHLALPSSRSSKKMGNYSEPGSAREFVPVEKREGFTDLVITEEEINGRPFRKRANSAFPFTPTVSLDPTAVNVARRLSRGTLHITTEGVFSSLDDNSTLIHDVGPSSPLVPRFHSFAKAAATRMERRESINQLVLQDTHRRGSASPKSGHALDGSRHKHLVTLPSIVQEPTDDDDRDSLPEDATRAINKPPVHDNPNSDNSITLLPSASTTTLIPSASNITIASSTSMISPSFLNLYTPPLTSLSVPIQPNPPSTSSPNAIRKDITPTYDSIRKLDTTTPPEFPTPKYDEAKTPVVFQWPKTASEQGKEAFALLPSPPSMLTITTLLPSASSLNLDSSSSSSSSSSDSSTSTTTITSPSVPTTLPPPLPQQPPPVPQQQQPPPLPHQPPPPHPPQHHQPPPPPHPRPKKAEKQDEQDEPSTVPVKSSPPLNPYPHTTSPPSSEHGDAEINKSVDDGQEVLDEDTKNFLIDAWNVVLQDADGSSVKLRENPRTVELMEHGVPMEVRPEIWLTLCGAREEQKRYHHEYYRSLVNVCQEHGFPAKVQIAKDVNRTLPSEPLFRTEEGRKKLERVLSAYCLRNPESVGYCQSMNQIAGALLTVLKDEEHAFWTLSCLIESKMGYYSKSMCGLVVDQLVFQDLLAFLEPTLYDHLKKLGVSTQAFTVSWFLCLFVEAPLDLQSAILFWDSLFLYGDELLFQMAFAIFRVKKKELLQMQEDGEVLTLMLHGPFKFNIPALMADIDIGVLIKKISALRDFHQSEVVRKKSLIHPRSAMLSQEFKISDDDVQVLWRRFLNPSPWRILLHSSISSPVWFYQCFCREVFPRAERTMWRDRGLFSGLIQRVMEVMDTSGSGQITFEEYLEGVRIFKKALQEERGRFAFRFCDFDGTGRVSKNNLVRAFYMLHLTYHGERDTAACEMDANLIFEKAQQAQELERIKIAPKKKLEEGIRRNTSMSTMTLLAMGLETLVDPFENVPREEDALSFESFHKYIAIHPLMCSFFHLDPTTIPSLSQ